MSETIVAEYLGMTLQVDNLDHQTWRSSNIAPSTISICRNAMIAA